MRFSARNARLLATCRLADSPFPTTIRAPRPSTPRGPPTTSIQFAAQVSLVDELKNALDLHTNRQVGEVAFERLYDEEIG